MGATVYYASDSELATLTNTFSVNGVATDPTTVTLVVTSPSGVDTTTTDAGLTHTPGTGLYSLDVACTEPGVWQYVWTGTGTASDVTAGTWTVLSTALATLYVTPEELKGRLGISDTVDDFEVRAAVESVSRGIEKVCGERQFFRDTQTRLYAADDFYTCPIDDLVSVTTLKTDDDGDGVFETTWATSDYELLPVNPRRAGETWPYTTIHAVGSRSFPLNRSPSGRRHRVQVAGTFGWPAVPSGVSSAARMLAAEQFKTKDAPFGFANVGDMAVRIRRNSIAMDLLSPYVRYPVLVA